MLQRTVVSFVSALVMTLAFQHPAWAVIYRWVDDKGVVHFAEQAPPGVNATPVDVRNNPVSAPPEQPGSAGRAGDGKPAVSEAGDEEQISYAEARRRERAENKRIRADEARTRDADCQVMRQQKAQAESGPRVLVTDENGEIRRLLDNEREDMLNEANAFLSANCI